VSSLPTTWIKPELSAVADVNPRKNVDLDDDELVTFVPMAAVDEISGTIASPVDRTYGEVSKGFTQFRNDDVIFAKITPSMENGKSAVARDLTNGIGIGSTEFHVLRSNGAIDPEFLWRFVRRKAFRENAQAVMSGAVGQQRVPTEYLKTHPVPLPPLPEQHRIVGKLDGLTARIARSRADLDRIPTLTARYKQRLLALLFSGVGPEHRYREIPFSDVIHSAQNGLSKRRGDAGRMINVLRLADLSNGQFDPQSPRTILLTSAEETKYGLQQDDLICIRVNGSEKLVGKMLVWGNDPTWAFCDHFIRFKIRSDIATAKYVSYFFSSDVVRIQIENSFVSSAGQKTVNQGILGRINIPLPSLSRQAEIVDRIESAFGWLDRVNSDHRAASSLLPKLEDAILAKAFRGELVPQDPNDEPASALLDRVRLVSEEAGTPRRSLERNIKREKVKMPDLQETLEADSAAWPDQGLGFEEIASRISADYEQLREAMFASLAAKPALLRQHFDPVAGQMRIQRVR
jgi:type I restriction enzyme S subunit